jgi:hypothetical protein
VRKRVDVIVVPLGEGTQKFADVPAATGGLLRSCRRIDP